MQGLSTAIKPAGTWSQGQSQEEPGAPGQQSQQAPGSVGGSVSESKGENNRGRQSTPECVPVCTHTHTERDRDTEREREGRGGGAREGKEGETQKETSKLKQHGYAELGHSLQARDRSASTLEFFILGTHTLYYRPSPSHCGGLL